MRLRLVHTLALTLLAFAGVSVLAMGGLTAWQLRNGFGEYLAARDVQHFDRFVGVVESRVASADGAADLLAGRIKLRSLLEELDPQPAFFPPVPQSPGPPGPPRFTEPTGSTGLSRTPPPDAGSPPFPDRIQLLALNGKVLLGPAQIRATGNAAFVQRPIHSNGRVIALARMKPSAVVRSGADARFLQDQYLLIAVGSAALTVLALLTATWLARRWTQPLSAIKDATQRLAQGEFAVRLADGPALAGRSDEIGDLVRNVNRMAVGLQQLESARRRWLADISHELRTPLTVLRGDIEALHDGIRPLEAAAITALRSDILRLNRLVDDLHLLAVADLQTLPCQLVEDDAIAMLQRVQDRHEGRANAAHLCLQLQLPERVPSLRVQWDTGRIEQLLGNLLENSLRYTQAPGEVRVCLEYTESSVHVIVEDSAPGLPAAQLSRLFEPLYRGEMASGGSPEGSGLGLSICQAIAKAHGGQLFAANSSLGGLRFTLLLPQPIGLPRLQPAGKIQ
jgi:two-component system sensor histidine kinase BaeS